LIDNKFLNLYTTGHIPRNHPFDQSKMVFEDRWKWSYMLWRKKDLVTHKT